MEKTSKNQTKKVVPEELMNFPGLDLPITIPESLIQRIWMQQAFMNQGLMLDSGKGLSVIHPGKWNSGPGPDFLGAELLVDGQGFIGDVEIHFFTKDWFNHGHHLNPNFSKVVLHVSLFQPLDYHPPQFTVEGYCPENLVLLPYLYQGVEEYALEYALLNFEGKDQLKCFDAFLSLPPEDKKVRLYNKAYDRWKQKCNFISNRLDTYTWEGLCHQMCLEVLGYRKNRIPMANIALSYPLETLAEGKIEAEALYESQEGHWKLSNLRPANQPLKRIQQYLNLVKENPKWTQAWLEFAHHLPEGGGELSTKVFRKINGLNAMLTLVKDTIFHGTISGTRFNTLLIDALLPLAAVYLKMDLFPLWYHMPTGDYPEAITTFLQHCAFEGADNTLCNGRVQGALFVFFEYGQ